MQHQSAKPPKMPKMPADNARRNHPAGDVYILWICCDCGFSNSWPTNPQCVGPNCPTQHIFQEGCCYFETHRIREGRLPVPVPAPAPAPKKRKA